MKNGVVKPIKDLLIHLGRQLDMLDPSKKPTDGTVAAANASAKVVGQYLNSIKTGLECAKLAGRKPDAALLGLSAPRTVEIEQ